MISLFVWEAVKFYRNTGTCRTVCVQTVIHSLDMMSLYLFEGSNNTPCRQNLPHRVQPSIHNILFPPALLWEMKRRFVSGDFFVQPALTFLQIFICVFRITLTISLFTWRLHFQRTSHYNAEHVSCDLGTQNLNYFSISKATTMLSRSPRSLSGLCPPNSTAEPLQWFFTKLGINILLDDTNQICNF